MDSRKKGILSAIIKEYTETAEPVGSAVLARRYNFKISPATLRNEMVELEEGGFLVQPHTSAGRVPTEEGYRYFVNHVLENAELPRQDVAMLHRCILELNRNQLDSLKILAKFLVDFTDAAIVIGFKRHDIYCTGLSRLFSQPEMSEQNTVVSMSEMIDQIDEIVSSLYDNAQNINVWIGRENPFTPLCGTVMAKIKFSEKNEMLLGLLGPVRMNYPKNIALIKSLSSLLLEI